jgi:hypothetical protein
MGKWYIDPRFLDLGTSWRWVVSFISLPSHRYPLDRVLDGLQSRPGRYREVKILDPSRIRTPTPQSSSSYPVATPITLPRPITRLTLRTSGQSFWLLIQESEFDSQRYKIFWEVVCLERCPLNFASTVVELLGRKSSGFRFRKPRIRPQGSVTLATLHHLSKKKILALTSPTCGVCSASIARSRTHATEDSFFF